jgi:uncharacterized protein YbjT (DUF2867 family)
MQPGNRVEKAVVVAGATGHLGQRIVASLSGLGARPKALARPDSHPASLQRLRNSGAETITADYKNGQSLATALSGAHCIVCALSGVEEVIVELQTVLLQVAIKAGVKKFISSDYCIDYTKLPGGQQPEP